MKGGRHAGDEPLLHGRTPRVPTVVEVRVTRCLWAQTFREAGAADIGYAMVCHPDFLAGPAFNPKIRMTRTKTLMLGDDLCNHRWVVEA